MAQQTAVDYLVKLYYTEYDILLPSEDYAQAKQMEKEQMFRYIERLYINGDASYEFHKKEFEQYYNATFGGQGSPDTSPNTQNK